jgi:hypothetical protein
MYKTASSDFPIQKTYSLGSSLDPREPCVTFAKVLPHQILPRPAMPQRMAQTG